MDVAVKAGQESMPAGLAKVLVLLGSALDVSAPKGTLEVYKQNGRLEKFSLPTVDVGEVELNLRYVVEDDSVQKEQFEINFSQLRKLSEKVSNQVAQAILGRGTAINDVMLFAAFSTIYQMFCLANVETKK